MMRQVREVSVRFSRGAYRPIGILAIAGLWITVLLGAINREKLAALAGAGTYLLLGLMVLLRALVPGSEDPSRSAAPLAGRGKRRSERDTGAKGHLSHERPD